MSANITIKCNRNTHFFIMLQVTTLKRLQILAGETAPCNYNVYKVDRTWGRQQPEGSESYYARNIIGLESAGWATEDGARLVACVAYDAHSRVRVFVRAEMFHPALQTNCCPGTAMHAICIRVCATCAHGARILERRSARTTRPHN